MAQTVKHLPKMPETRVQSLGWEDLLEKEMATHSSVLAWRIPWTEEPGRLQYMDFKELDTTERLHIHFQCSTGNKSYLEGNCFINSLLTCWVKKKQGCCMVK